MIPGPLDYAGLPLIGHAAYVVETDCSILCHSNGNNIAFRLSYITSSAYALYKAQLGEATMQTAF